MVDTGSFGSKREGGVTHHSTARALYGVDVGAPPGALALRDPSSIVNRQSSIAYRRLMDPEVRE
jgi:hypothetical protein